VRLLPPSVARARAHARRFPPPFWGLVVAEAVRELGSGLFVAYWALYLTDTVGASGAQAGVLLAVAGAMGFIGSPLGGVLADRVGRRRTMLVSYAATGLALILYGSLSSLTALAVFTPFFGITSDLQSPAAKAAVADVVETSLHSEAYGLRLQAGNAAFALGPPLGALVIHLLGTRWVFVGAGVAWLAAFAVIHARVPETRPERTDALAPPRFREALRSRPLLLLALGGGLSVVVFAQYDSVLGVFLHRDRGVSIAAWGLLFGINPVLTALTQFHVARRAARFGPRKVLITGILLQGAALFVLWPLHGLAIVAVSVVAITVGEMLLAPTTTALAAALAPVHLRGSYQGVLEVSFSVFWPAGTAVGLALVGHGHGVWMLGAALPFAVGGALAFWPLPRRPLHVDEVLPVPSEAAIAP
jgi:MFS family permease